MDNYAPVNQTLTYNSFDDYSRDIDKLDVPSDPYNVPNNYYTKLALRQWKICPSNVAKLYFSVENIKRIQKSIKREIYNRSYKKYKLNEDQSVLDLLQAMIIVYEDKSKNLPYETIRQVKMLNEFTVQYVSPDIMTNLKQHYGYLKDINNPTEPIPPPINVNHAGRLQLTGTDVYNIYGL